MKKINFSLKGTLKILAVNVLVLLALLFILNLSAVLIYNIYQVYQAIEAYFTENNTSIHQEALLPNYKNIDWAKQHFIEFYDTKMEYKSFVGWRTIPYNGQTININESGIRNTPQTKLVVENAPTVVFLGGSAMWGVGVNDENTIPAHFVDISKQCYKAFNFGEIAYNALQNFVFLKLQMLDGLDPDIIVSYDGVNETGKYLKELGLYSHYRESQIRNRLKGIDTTSIETLKFRNFFWGPVESFINQLFEKFNINRRSIDQELKSNYNVNPARTERIVKELLDSWLSIKELAEQNDAIFVAVLQPNIATGNPRVDHIEVEINPEYYEVELTRILYPKIIDMINTPDYRELKNNFLDLRHAFDVDEYIYIDECHVSPNGNRIIAEYLNDYINSLNLNNKGE